MTAETTEHVRKNREHWEQESDEYQERNRAQLNRWDLLGWGVYDVAEDEIQCARRRRRAARAGARLWRLPVRHQGGHARREGDRARLLDRAAASWLENFDETGVRFPVVQASGERVPFRDEAFDLVFCDHGVMGFADPFLTVPEVARVLRPGGRFVFNGTTPWIWVAWGQQEEELPATREMRSDYFGLRSAEFEDPSWRTTEFQLTYGDWIRLFRANGLVVEDLIELRPDEDATDDLRRLRAARVGAGIPGRAHLEGAEGVSSTAPARRMAGAALAALAGTRRGGSRGPPPTPVPIDRPNVIVVLTDDQRADTFGAMPWLAGELARGAIPAG